MSFGSTGRCLAMVKCNEQYEKIALEILLVWSFANTRIILADWIETIGGCCIKLP